MSPLSPNESKIAMVDWKLQKFLSLNLTVEFQPRKQFLLTQTVGFRSSQAPLPMVEWKYFKIGAEGAPLWMDGWMAGSVFKLVD